MSPFMQAVADAASANVRRLYETNKVPHAPQYPYTVFSVSADRPDVYTLDASHGLRYYRIIWQSFGESVEAATNLDDLMTAALLDQRLEVDGYETGPCRSDQTVLGALVRDPDSLGVIGVTSSLLFTATPIS